MTFFLSPEVSTVNKINQDRYQDFLACWEQLFKRVEIFSTVETVFRTMSRSRLWIETISRQIETPMLNLKKPVHSKEFYKLHKLSKCRKSTSSKYGYSWLVHQKIDNWTHINKNSNLEFTCLNVMTCSSAIAMATPSKLFSVF